MPSGMISGLLHLHQCPYHYPHPQAGVILFHKSYVPPSKAAQAPMLQVKPHQCEDLNHLTGKGKPHQILVRNRACLGEMSPWQRQHSLGCYIWYCPFHKHPEFWCFSPNPCCSTLGPDVKIPLFAILLLITSIAETGFKPWVQPSQRKQLRFFSFFCF